MRVYIPLFDVHMIFILSYVRTLQLALICEHFSLLFFFYQGYVFSDEFSNGTTLIDKITLTDLLFEQLQRYVNYSTINNLLNLSKKYKGVKKLQFFWKLNNKYSVKYYRENDFKFKLNALLDFGGYDSIWDVTSLRNIYSLDLSFCYRYMQYTYFFTNTYKYLHVYIQLHICI
jgi:hypothetical protein